MSGGDQGDGARSPSGVLLTRRTGRAGPLHQVAGEPFQIDRSWHGLDHNWSFPAKPQSPAGRPVTPLARLCPVSQTVPAEGEFPAAEARTELPVARAREHGKAAMTTRPERRLSEAAGESYLVDGHFCGEDMSPPQLRGRGMIGVIAVRRARMRRGAPAEGRARGRAGRGWSGSRPQAVIPDAARGGGQPGPTAPPGQPQSLPIAGPDDRSRGRHLERSGRPARAGSRSLPGNARCRRELISEPGMPSAELARQARERTGT